MPEIIANCNYDVISDEPEAEVPNECFTDEERLKLSKIFETKLKDDRLIKNPFVCRSDFQVRVALDKDPRKNIGNTDFCELYETEEGSVHLINQLDSKSSFIFGKTTPNKLQEYSIINKYDYELSADYLNEKRNDGKELHKDPLPLSFIQINNERDGALWYKNNYPRIPDDLIPIIARYHWGEPITKKCIRNEKKKIIKKTQQKGLEIQHKKVSVIFD